MAIATRRNQNVPYVPIEDRSAPLDKRTTFPIRLMTARAMAKVKDAGAHVSGDGSFSARMHMFFFMAVKYGVAGWDNLPDENGVQVKAVLGVDADGDPVLMDESIDRIRHLIEELAGAVMKENGLTERDLGNSSSSPASPQAGSSPTVLSGEALVVATSNCPSSAPSATELPPNRAASSVSNAEGAAQSPSG